MCHIGQDAKFPGAFMDSWRDFWGKKKGDVKSVDIMSGLTYLMAPKEEGELLVHLSLLLGRIVLTGKVGGEGLGVAVHQGDGALAKDAWKPGDNHLAQRLRCYWRTKSSSLSFR